MNEVPHEPFTTMDYIVDGIHLLGLISLIVFGVAYVIKDYKNFKLKNN